MINPNVNAALNRKYSVQETEARARETEANSNAALNAVRARMLPEETSAQAALARANAYHVGQQGAMVAPLAQAQIGETQSRTGENQARVPLLGAEAEHQRQQAQMVAPLAQSQIANTRAQIQEALSRSGLYGAQTVGAMHPYLPGSEADYMNTYQQMRQWQLQHGVQGGGPVAGNVAPVVNQYTDGDFPQNAPYVGGRACGGMVHSKGFAEGGLVHRPSGWDDLDGGRTPWQGVDVYGNPMYFGDTPRYHDKSMTPPAPATPRNYAEGTDQVSAPGDGSRDTVTAKLANGEGVLNAGAAEMVGPHLINVLNAIGEFKMASQGRAPVSAGAGEPDQDDQAQPTGKGMPAPKKAAGGSAKGGKKGFAQGTTFVQGFGAPSSPQESQSGFEKALQIQDPNSTANVVADIRAKLRNDGNATPPIRRILGFADGGIVGGYVDAPMQNSGVNLGTWGGASGGWAAGQSGGFAPAGQTPVPGARRLDGSYKDPFSQ